MILDFQKNYLSLTNRSVKKILFIMSPRTEEQFAEIRKGKRRLILDAALKLFAKKGYHAGTMAKVAQEAGVSKGLIYNYFKNKKDLLNALVNDAAEDIMNFFDPNRDGVLTEDEFFFFLEKLKESIINNRSYWQFYISIMSQSHVAELIEQHTDIKQNEYAQMLIDFFEKCNCKNPQAEMFLFSMTLKGTLMTYILSPDAFPLEYAIDTISQSYKEKIAHCKSNK
jgi:AcrR family transcriptional regulator